MTHEDPEYGGLFGNVDSAYTYTSGHRQVHVIEDDEEDYDLKEGSEVSMTHSSSSMRHDAGGMTAWHPSSSMPMSSHESERYVP